MNRHIDCVKMKNDIQKMLYADANGKFSEYTKLVYRISDSFPMMRAFVIAQKTTASPQPKLI